MNSKFSASPTLAGLKDFQRRTVEYAFNRMFKEAAPARRFLVADEVGLGKTLVAKGLIAKTIEHLQETTKRVDIIYVCSNADIAAQNVGRLMLPGLPSFAQATRLTLLPLVTERLREHKINFISFTPGTTFNQGNRTGRKDERHLIYRMLRELPRISERGLRDALQGSAGDGWDAEAQREIIFDQEIAEEFRAKVMSDDKLFTSVEVVCERFRDRRTTKTLSHEDRNACLEMIGALRRQLAKTCLTALEPDLVILDEFQRFSELFDDPEEHPAAELAHALFNYSADLRVLLLSATPYKMYASDADAEDHYADFLRTMDFLLPDKYHVKELEEDLSQFRTCLLGARDEADLHHLDTTKKKIETTLKQVMCRTERVSSTLRGDAMVKECFISPDLKSRDLSDLTMIEAVGKVLEERESIEYWKSSPYLFNFMKDYKLKQSLRGRQNSKSTILCDLFAGSLANLLHRRQIDKYKQVDPGNARLRTLQREVEESGIWRLLWMPPSLPYWQPLGSYRDVPSVSKQLIFSAWNVVPDAVASMLSYAVERHIVEQSGIQTSYSKMPDRFSPRLIFARKGEQLSGMTTLMLMFPSITLATIVNPIKLAGEQGGFPSWDSIKQTVVARLSPMIEPLINRQVRTGFPDRRWYWVALARFEAHTNPEMRQWCFDRWQGARRSLLNEDGRNSEAFESHVQLWLEAWDGKLIGLGRVPDDLIDIIANLALSGPAVCALRAMLAHWPIGDGPRSSALDAAVHIAEGFRSQFNAPTAIALLRGAEEEEDSYWKQVLQYCADGNLQALLDEFSHTLVESQNLGDMEPDKAVRGLAEAMFEAMSLRTTTLRPDELNIEDGQLSIVPFPMRCHFALRFGDMDDEAGAVARKENVLASFNSPFKPFVLASTSVGQEGLDFHTWCHSIIHWNLPSNPVDMEQREGRVHRYKGHAVRKNVATRYGAQLFNLPCDTHTDPWNRLFEIAISERAQGVSDLVPYWIFEVEGGAKIERRIMSLPLSRDELRYRRLRKSLALYRMVFAQPRQEDLLNYLTEVFGDERAPDIAARWKICLSPT